MSFYVVPEIAVSPVSGTPGTQVTVTGSGFVASRSVSIYFDSSVFDTTTSDASGSINTTASIPPSSNGLHIIYATDSQLFLE